MQESFYPTVPVSAPLYKAASQNGSRYRPYTFEDRSFPKIHLTTGIKDVIIKTGRCLLVTDIPLLWDLNGCHDTYNYCESNDPMSRLLVADGSLLSVMELVPRLIKHPGNGNDPEHILKCNRNMYHLPEKNFPRGYTHASTPHSRDGRQPSSTAYRL